MIAAGIVHAEHHCGKPEHMRLALQNLDRASGSLLACSVSPEIPLQKTMFSGEWDDNRTAKQREQDDEHAQRPAAQLPLFDRGLSESGESSQPMLRDITPPAQENTTPSDDSSEVNNFGEWNDRIEDEAQRDTADGPAAIESPSRTVEEIYMELVRIAQEVAETVWIEPHYMDRYRAQLQVLVLEARTAGLSDVEIDLAFLIGETRGRQAREQRR